MSFDWSKFKKIDQNKDHVVLRSTEGHILYVKNKSLHKDIKKALHELPIQKLSRGGLVESTKERQSLEHLMAQGFSKMADGGIVKEQDAQLDKDSTPTAPSDTNPLNQPNPAVESVINGVSSFLGNAGRNAIQGFSPSPDQLAQFDAQKASLQKTGTPLTQAEPELKAAVPDMGGEASPVAQPTPELASDKRLLGAFDQTERGMKGVANAEQATAENQGKVLAGAITDLQKQQEQSQARQAAIMQHNDELTQKLAQQDPKSLITDHSLGNRLLSAVGIMLGGGLIVGAVNKYLDQEVEQQRQQRSQNENLFSLNEKRLGDERSAADMTKLNLLSLMELKMKQEATKGVALSAQPGLQKNLGQLQLEKAKLIQSIDQHQQAYATLGKTRESTPQAIGQFIDNVIPEHQRAKAYEELGSMQAMQAASAAVKSDYAEIRNAGRGALVPLTVSAADFDTTRSKLLANVIKSLGSNPSDRDMKTIDTMLPNRKDLISPAKDTILAHKEKSLDKFLKDKQAQSAPTPILSSKGIKLAVPATSKFQAR